VETALRFLADWNLTKVALIHDTSHYSRDLATRIEQQLAARPLTVIYDTILAPGLKDYRPLLEDIQRSNPEVIFFTGYYPEAAVLLAGRKEMRWPVAFLAGAAAGGPGLVDVAGKKAVRGTYFLSMPLVKNLPALEAKRFVSLYRKRYGQRPSSIYALMAGDAFRVIAKAIESTGSTDSVKLAGYLHKDLNNFPGMTGLITFDAKGDREAQVYVPYRFDEKGRAEPAYK
jgi:branched-chain amino acid transport system substrate-binding protein